jgi:hypothetical protein
MIIHEFDNGWHRQYPLKQYELEITNQLLQPFVHSRKKVVVINSVWYTNEFHQSVCKWLTANEFDHIVLIAMLDAAIPQPDWYVSFGRPVTGIGYYQGLGAIDFCALFVDKFLDVNGFDLHNSALIDTAYMCLMRKPHGHRKQLFWKFKQADLLKHGLVSMGSVDGQPWASLPEDTESDNLAPNAAVSHYGVPNDIVSLGHKNNWHRHFVNVVAETFYDINRNNFVSEKIYKPIVGGRPFVVFDPDGGQHWLTSRGFEPYARDFGDICDLDVYDPEHVVRFLQILSKQPAGYWRAKFVDLLPKIQYNQQRFKKYASEQHQIIEQGIQCQI